VSDNPYLPPQQAAVAGHPEVPTGQKPKWFLFLVVGTILLASLGVLAGLWAPVSLIVTRNNPFWMSAPPPGMADFQERITEATMPELQAALGVVNLLVGAFALYASIRLMQLRPSSRAPYAMAVALLAGYEAVALALGLVVSWRTWGVMQEMFDATLHGAGGVPAEAEQIVNATLRVGMLVGLAFAVFWGGAKIGFCLWARGYASKPEMAAYIDGSVPRS
jgi:hypothetical protein